MGFESIVAAFIGSIATILPLWLWIRSESRADVRHMESNVNTISEAIRQDMKDFHGRLCAIEEKRRGR